MTIAKRKAELEIAEIAKIKGKRNIELFDKMIEQVKQEAKQEAQAEMLKMLDDLDWNEAIDYKKLTKRELEICRWIVEQIKKWLKQ